jgi:hypothetical protein
LQQKPRLLWTLLVWLLLLAGCVTPGTSNGSATTAPAAANDQPKTAESEGPIGSIVAIRVGKQEGFDRLVIELNAPGAGYDIRYVENVLTDGKGDLVPLKGDAKLRIVVRAPNHDENARVTYQAKSGEPLPNVNVTDFNIFRDAKWAGSFEGQSTIGLGVRTQLPFNVFKLTNPSRIVVDVYLKG